MERGAGNLIAEGKAEINAPKGVFFNPEMEFCRDLSVLVIRAALAGKAIRAVDATAGSGIRAIRYAKECEGAVGELFLVDLNPSAVKAAESNLARNNVKGNVVESSFARFANSAYAKGGFGLIEIDPFGTPVPFLYDACRISRDGTLLSVTATDTAVLCGAHPKACLKNYQAKPLNPFMCHEVGARILLGKIARTASEFNYGLKPLLTLSHRHYFKIFVLFEEGAEKAVASIKELGYLAHCNKCFNSVSVKGVANNLPTKCGRCGEQFEYAGPLWLGKLHDGEMLKKIIALNERRNAEIDKVVSLMLEEERMPAFYFELHRITERLKINAVSPSAVMLELKRNGFAASPTHFQTNSIKTDGTIRDVEAAVRKAGKKTYK